MDRRDLEAAAADVTYLRGLLAVPFGLVIVASGLGNLRWGPLAHLWVFPVCVAVLALVALGITRYYNDNYGRVTPSKRQQVRYTVFSAVLFGTSMVGGPILDTTFDLPVSVFTVAFALAMLVWFAVCVGLRIRHAVIWGVLLVVGLAPVWGSLADKISVAFLPIGVATVVAGIFDHRALVRSFGSAGDLRLESSNAGA